MTALLCAELITPDQAMGLLREHIDALILHGREHVYDAQVVGVPEVYGHVFAVCDQRAVHIALKKKLLTVEQIAAIPHQELSLVLKGMLHPNGITALQEKIFTPEDMVTLADHAECDFYKTHFGTLSHPLSRALKECIKNKIITLEDITAPPRPGPQWWVKVLEKEGINISSTQKEIILPYDLLSMLFSESGIGALREGLINPSQAASMGHNVLYTLLLREGGSSALGEKLITPEQAMNIYAHERDALHFLINNPSCLSALRKGLMTAEQVSQAASKGAYPREEGIGKSSLVDDAEHILILSKLTSKNAGESIENLLKSIKWIFLEKPRDHGYSDNHLLHCKRYKYSSQAWLETITERASRLFAYYQSEHPFYQNFVNAVSEKLNKANQNLFTWDDKLKEQINGAMKKIQEYGHSLPAKDKNKKEGIKKICGTLTQAIAGFKPKDPATCTTKEERILSQLEILAFKLKVAATLHGQDKLLYRNPIWKKIVVNFLAILFTGGIANLAYWAYQTRQGKKPSHVLFFSKTPYERNVDAIDKLTLRFQRPAS